MTGLCKPERFGIAMLSNIYYNEDFDETKQFSWFCLVKVCFKEVLIEKALADFFKKTSRTYL